MRHVATLILSGAVLTGAGKAAAQDRDMLPMTFVRVDTEVAKRLEADWKRLHAAGREWVYCITAWSTALTQDRDTVFVVAKVELVSARMDGHEASGFACRTKEGAILPIAHAHPSGDCSPSRADATYSIAHPTLFSLIVCGPRATVGYTTRQFVWMSRGAIWEVWPGSVQQQRAPDPR